MSLKPNYLSKYFKGKGELWKAFDPPDQEALTNLKELAVEVLDPIRIAANQPLHVTSGFRGVKYNASIGGAKRSPHTLGQAADIYCASLTGLELFLLVAKLALTNPKIGGIGLYHDENHKAKFVHVDTRPRISGRVVIWYCNDDDDYVALPKPYLDILTKMGLKCITGGIWN